MDIIIGLYIINHSTYTGVGETDGYRYDVIFIMVDISEVFYGAHDDKFPLCSALHSYLIALSIIIIIIIIVVKSLKYLNNMFSYIMLPDLLITCHLIS